MSGVIKGAGKFLGGAIKSGVGGLLSGGPWGALAGAALGGLGGLLTRPQEDPRFGPQQQALQGLMGFQGRNLISPGTMGLFQQLANQQTPNIGAFMDPYQQNVIDAARPEFARQRDLAVRNVGDRATMARAFGGARHGLAEGEALGAIGRAEAQTIADLQSRGFSQALQAAQNQQGFQLGAAGQLAGLEQLPFQQQIQIAQALAMQPQIQGRPGAAQSFLGGAGAGLGIWDWLRQRSPGMPTISGPTPQVQNTEYVEPGLRGAPTAFPRR